MSIMREINEKFDFAHRIARIMEIYDKENCCQLQYYMDSVRALDDCDKSYVVISALFEVLKAINNGEQATFNNIEQYEYETDAFDELDFYDYEDYLKYNHTITETDVKIKSKEIVQEQIAMMLGTDKDNVKKCIESFNRKKIVYGLVKHIESFNTL